MVDICDKLYKDEQLLYWLYWGEKYTIKQICVLLDSSYGKVHWSFNKLKIPTRTAGGGNGRKKIFTDNKMVDDLVKSLYIKMLLPRDEICSLVGCSKGTLDKIIINLGLKRKLISRHLKPVIDESGCNCKGRKVVFDVPKECIDFINGEMLGDGNIRCGQYTAVIQYGSNHKSYLEWLSKTLASWGIEQGGKINSYTRKGNNNGISKMNSCNKYNNRYNEREYTCHHYCSKSYAILKDLYDKWYLTDFSFCPYCEILFHDETCSRREWERYTTCPVCNEHHLFKKVIPEDLELTPLTCRQFYIGDGALVSSGQIMFCISNFIMKDIKLLKDKFTLIGIDVRIVGNEEKGYNLNMKVDDSRKFILYIGNCPVDCYSYKWIDMGNVILMENVKAILSNISYEESFNPKLVSVVHKRGYQLSYRQILSGMRYLRDTGRVKCIDKNLDLWKIISK